MSGADAAKQAVNRIGVDTGGTFTDFVWLGGDEVQVHKQLSTPADPSDAVLEGIAHMPVPPAAGVVHGSTVATNALLERRGARTALITTAGFADVLAIGRQDRPALYALVPHKAPPLVPRRWRLEVAERVDAQGHVVRPLDPEELAPLVAQIASSEIESVAICLLFSFLRPEHEQAIARRLRDRVRRPLHISLSSEILPEYREYERTATTVINAYVAPRMSRYLRRLQEGLAPRKLAVMQSNGGVISSEAAGRQAARTVLSGPAGGVVGAFYIAKQAGLEEIITFDMGGTSTDVALCPARLPTTAEGTIAGLPLRLPTMDIHTVGAGGGSLAFLDAAAALHVGPRSAGADPGPASYGRTVDETAYDFGLPLTVTDANLVLGRLDADHFLGGAMRLDAERAMRALDPLAKRLGVGDAEAAWDIIRVANATMERAIRAISVERGYDPRRFTLVAFGGAGPLHACDLARSLQIARVLVPPAPGVLSALGMLVAAPAKDFSTTVMIEEGNGRCAAQAVVAHLEPMIERARNEMSAEGHDPATLEFDYRLDMRYAGQSHELTVAVDPFASPFRGRTLFEEAYEKRYGYRRPHAPVEIVTVRLEVRAHALPPSLPRLPAGTADAAPAHIGKKEAWFGGRMMPTALYLRDHLRPGNRLDGPAIVFQYDATTIVPPGWGATVDGFGNLLLDRRED